MPPDPTTGISTTDEARKTFRSAIGFTAGPDRPPKYPTTYYTDYMIEYQKRTYDLLADQQAAE